MSLSSVKTKTVYGVKFVLIPDGSNRIGNAESRKPVKHVSLPKFWLSQTEITNDQFELLLKHKRGKESPGNLMPVTEVFRTDAERYTRMLSEKSGRTVRLPTEAEWEYAARGGLRGFDFPWGSSTQDGLVNSGSGKATNVGSYPPNPYGLYDMTGNACEYVADDYWSDETLARKLPPLAWMVKGGSFSDWNAFVWFAVPIPRDMNREDLVDVGFRVLMEYDKEEDDTNDGLR